MKRSDIYTTRSYALLLLTQLLALAAAMCSKYTASSDIGDQLRFPTRGHDFHVGQMSPVLSCPAEEHQGGHNCADPSSFDGRGCYLEMKAYTASSGFVMGPGSILADPNELDNVFDLVNKAVNKAHNASVLLHLFRYAASCIQPTNLAGSLNEHCVQPGKSAYIDGTRLTFCTNGTLSGCDKDGSFQDGRPIQVCGPRIIEHPSEPNHTLHLDTSLVYVNASEAAEHKNYLAYNKKARKECKALENNAAAVASSVSSILLRTAAATLTIGFVVLG